MYTRFSYAIGLTRGGQLRFSGARRNVDMMRFLIRRNAGEAYGQDTVFHDGFYGFHWDVGWKCKGPDEGTSSSLSQNVTIILSKERSDLARDRQPIVEHFDSDLVSRDAREFEGCCYHVRHRILKYVHSWLEDTTLPGDLSDVMVRTSVVVHQIVVVVRWVHVVMVFCEGHVGG